MEVVDLGPTQLKNIEKTNQGLFAAGRHPRLRRSPRRRKPPRRRGVRRFPRAARCGVRAVACVDCRSCLVFPRRQPLGAGRDQGTRRSRPTPPSSALPFYKPLRLDPAQDYFADGVTGNLTTELSRIRNQLQGIARNTAFTFKGKNLDAKAIGRELGVRYVLEGSVQRDASRVRVNAQLIDAETGAHLWADRFDEDVADLFKLQDEVVARTRPHASDRAGECRGPA